MIKRLIAKWIFWRMSIIRSEKKLALDFYMLATRTKDERAMLVAVKAMDKHHKELERLHKTLKRWAA